MYMSVCIYIRVNIRMCAHVRVNLILFSEAGGTHSENLPIYKNIPVNVSTCSIRACAHLRFFGPYKRGYTYFCLYVLYICVFALVFQSKSTHAYIN